MTTPPFLRKLWEMVNDPQNKPFISWLEDGDGFQVLQPRELGTQILPNYFNGTMCSFIRQLNLYGFSKLGDEFAFKHHDGFFKYGQENLLQFIERRKNIKSKSRTELDKSGEPNKQQKTSKKPVKSQETKPEPETDQDPLAQLIHSHNAHDFMINWLTQELHHQQREIVLLREQLVSLTQTLRYPVNTIPTLPGNYNSGQFRPNFGHQSTNRNLVQIYTTTPPATNSSMSHVPHGNNYSAPNGNDMGMLTIPTHFSQKNSQNGYHPPASEIFQFHPPSSSFSEKIPPQNGNPGSEGIFFPERKNNVTPFGSVHVTTPYSTETESSIQTTPPLNAEYLDFEQYPENIFSGLDGYDLDLGDDFESK